MERCSYAILQYVKSHAKSNKTVEPGSGCTDTERELSFFCSYANAHNRGL